VAHQRRAHVALFMTQMGENFRFDEVTASRWGRHAPIAIGGVCAHHFCRLIGAEERWRWRSPVLSSGGNDTLLEWGKEESRGWRGC
jgi:hypothetical protein